MNKREKPSRHTTEIRQYAEDSIHYEKPWLKWRCRKDHEGSSWGNCAHYPYWSEDMIYEHIPEIIKINGHEVPKPYRGEIQEGVDYYQVAPNMPEFYIWVREGSYGSSQLNHLRDRGLLHDNKEAAVAHAKALLSFTKEES